ncbi:integrase core domain-containing protein [Tahibacter amnicola]|uniref:Integrase core domain-containing protein n=2 Tax=Tahibacter amnicola TaxID=2976241 RepID=A0ABY6BDF5_9GAMM|nr:integrase core domain-containing protein [Tahibacter amnicola]UXI68059.1 integrase core domain-containing protein [Tahibacter amnicola]UXI70442.1 integrase core domain-containing protein [Tahibacter amnicola]
MRIALRCLGIRLQRTELHCPWQNGRIERLFGTLKSYLDRIAIGNGDDLRTKLVEFRCWYNHVRPHQHLAGRTPAETWSGRSKARGEPEWFSGWNGRLTGWYFAGT